MIKAPVVQQSKLRDRRFCLAAEKASLLSNNMILLFYNKKEGIGMKQPRLSGRTKALLLGLQLVLGSLIVLIFGLLVSSLEVLGQIFAGESNQFAIGGASHPVGNFQAGHFHLTLAGQGAWLKLSAAGWLIDVGLIIVALALVSLLLHRLRYRQFFVHKNVAILHGLFGVMAARMLIAYLALLAGGEGGLSAAALATGLALGTYVITALFQRGYALTLEGARLI